MEDISKVLNLLWYGGQIVKDRRSFGSMNWKIDFSNGDINLMDLMGSPSSFHSVVIAYEEKSYWNNRY